MKNRALLVCLLGCLCGLAACATTNKPRTKQNGMSAQSIATSVATQPLRDLNFIRTQIPPALAQIIDPYATPVGFECSWIYYQLSQLDEVLPPEEVRRASIDERSTAERSGAIVSEAAEDVVRAAGSSVMPARNVVRRLSGASAAEREFNKALELGQIRRGYLRGLAEGRNCGRARPKNNR
ncbi:MAG: hypothetical protein FD163_1020 [Hyphomonadaceae bacterium]|nr:MAG: hypothetical protein FD163_1020 [Hyphomonadaceae bacterium]